MVLNKNQEAFFALLKAGLWEKDVQLLPYDDIDFEYILKTAEEQSIIGLIAAGIDKLKKLDANLNVNIPKTVACQFIGQTLKLEERNKAMNRFISELIRKMQNASIYTILIKGQGVAQCYERPLWRSSGDVDLFFDADNYHKAFKFLAPLASYISNEDSKRLHVAMIIDHWEVELHGTMHTEISKKIDSGVDSTQKDIFENDGIRIWNNEGTEIALPNPNNDIIIVFTHFIDHFYVGGVGLRQISDWCRLLWKYYDHFDLALLEKRIRAMGLLTEWRVFAALAVTYMGMPKIAMPFYDESNKDLRKVRKVLHLMLYTGNFGHNKDESYRSRYPKMIGKVITFFRRFGEFLRITMIFPQNAPKFFLTYVNRSVS